MGKTAGGEIMLWRYLDIRTITEEEFHSWYAMADDARRKKCDACRDPDDRLCSIAGDHLARTLLSEFRGCDPASIRFARGENGKPWAVDLNAHFNISHSGHLVVCAVSEKPVGIDAERIRPVRAKLADRVCTPAELAYVREAPGWGETLTDEAMIRFFRIWTAKEAYFKWAGTGITDLKSVDTLVMTGNSFELDGYMVCIHE